MSRGRWLIGQHFSTGAKAILRGCGPALWPGEWRERFARWFLLLLVATVLGSAVVQHLWMWALLVVGAFVVPVAVGRQAATVPDDEEEEDDEPEAEALEDAPEDELVPLHPDDVREIVHQLGAGTGVLLTTLRAHLTRELPDRPWTTAAVRELLADAGVRVRDGVRVPGVGNAAGVHRDDIQTPLSPAPGDPSPTVVVPGQRDNNNGNNGPTVLEHDGDLIICTPDEDNPVRTHVRVIPGAGRSRTGVS